MSTSFLLPYSCTVTSPSPSPSRSLQRKGQRGLKPSVLRVCLEEQSPSTTSTATPSKNSIWVNPNSHRAAALHQSSSSSRHARLLAVAASLSTCTTSSSISALLASTPRFSEQDAISVLNLVDNPSSAHLALHWFLENLNIRRKTVVYNVTLKAARKARSWAAAEALLDEMLSKGVQPDNITFSTLISCARMCNLPDKAVELFERMGEFGCDPDDVTYSAMIDAYGRAGKVEMALGIYDRARKENWKLDAVTFSTVIKVYGIARNYDGALNVFEEMKALGVNPNLVTYNVLLDGMGRAGRPWQVKAIFKEMVANGFAPNRATYAALVRAYAKARYADDAMFVYREMRGKGVELNVVLYNTLLAMCADLGLVDEAFEVFADLKAAQHNGCSPDSWTFSSLITIYSCSGNVSQAENVMVEMVEAGYQPNIFVLTSLIQCYGKAKRIDDVVKTFGKVMELGIAPDDRFCGCLLNVMTHTPEAELGKIVGCIDRTRPEVASLVRALLDAANVSNDTFKNEAEDLFGNISKEVNKAYCNCLIDVCINLNLLERACILLELALRLEIYTALQSKSAAQWSLHVKSLSLGAALTALHVWMNDLSRALSAGEELPPLLGIHTGHGKHKYSSRGLAVVLEGHLRHLNAPFHESPDKVGWFLTTKDAAKTWLELRSSSSEEVAAAS